MTINIRETNEQDRKTIFQVEDLAFNDPEVPVLADELLYDPTARPLLSLLAFDGEQAVGHILFTKGWLEGFEELSVSILAPLAIIPSHQKKGIGGQLIRAGLNLLKQQKGDLVFVLGHIDYYPRHGFVPALPQGFIPPYPTKKGLEDAWMVQTISTINLADCAGLVHVAMVMDKPENW
ncbi:GNAT family N-acetyltransferase [Candidatus Enterococcus ferrettii]|uniref:N-acetyltransferase domain-containing protein n=1 Tax=Candidatus Enterococcus ferrettii TaxID=2815324 RepID=A0ABV0EUD8_9ENTE|nr:N-acetyltransferase [Enterococcus sp. 665A]MBO1339551.1 N-acetyltransferase [Enterococcus sp. 665A]